MVTRARRHHQRAIINNAAGGTSNATLRHSPDRVPPQPVPPAGGGWRRSRQEAFRLVLDFLNRQWQLLPLRAAGLGAGWTVALKQERMIPLTPHGAPTPPPCQAGLLGCAAACRPRGAASDARRHQRTGAAAHRRSSAAQLVVSLKNVPLHLPPLSRQFQFHVRCSFPTNSASPADADCGHFVRPPHPTPRPVGLETNETRRVMCSTTMGITRGKPDAGSTRARQAAFTLLARPQINAQDGVTSQYGGAGRANEDIKQPNRPRRDGPFLLLGFGKIIRVLRHRNLVVIRNVPGLPLCGAANVFSVREELIFPSATPLCVR